MELLNLMVWGRDCDRRRGVHYDYMDEDVADYPTMLLLRPRRRTVNEKIRTGYGNGTGLAII